jgi:hypothetical protein
VVANPVRDACCSVCRMNAISSCAGHHGSTIAQECTGKIFSLQKISPVGLELGLVMRSVEVGPCACRLGDAKQQVSAKKVPFCAALFPVF